MHPRSHRVANPEVIHILRSSPLVHHPVTKKMGYSGGWSFFFQSILTINHNKTCKLQEVQLQASPRKSSKFYMFIKFIMSHHRNGRDSAWTQLSSLPKTYSLPSITAAAPQCKLIKKPLESQLTHLIDVCLQSFYTNKLCKVYNVYLKKHTHQQVLTRTSTFINQTPDHLLDGANLRSTRSFQSYVVTRCTASDGMVIKDVGNRHCAQPLWSTHRCKQ